MIACGPSTGELITSGLPLQESPGFTCPLGVNQFDFLQIAGRYHFAVFFGLHE
jgi:hypothetical protein